MADVYIDGVALNENTPEIAAINQVLKQLPPAGGGWSLPSIQQYAGIVTSVSKFYRNPDQAITASPTNARSMFNNLTIREPLQARMLATAELPWEIQPEDKKDKEQKEVAQSIQRSIEQIPDFLKYRYCLLYAIWFGKMANQNRYEWAYQSGRKRLKVKDWSPVHGDTLVPKYDDNTWGIYTGLYNGWDGTKTVTTEPGFLSRAHVLTDEKPKKLSLSERQAFVIHTHDYMPGDFLDPNSAGGVKGLGIRSVIYWTWYVMNEIAGWLIEFLERVGTGITIWRYLRGNSESEAAVRQIAESQSNQAAVLFPVDPSIGKNLEDVQRIEPSPVGIQNMMEVLDSYYGTQIRRYIVGQDGTSMPVVSGMNSGVSQAHENTFNRIMRYDALNLADTLTRDLVHVIQDWDFPGCDFRCRFGITVDRPDPEPTLTAIKLAYDMGVTFDEDEVRGITGMSKPDLDAVILGLPKAQGELDGPERMAGVDAGQDDTGDVPDATPGDPVPQGDSDGVLDQQPGEQASGPLTNQLRATVGGLQAISSLQQAVYAGTVPRVAAINNVILLFGFSPEEASSLFPEVPPEKTAPDEGGPPGGPPAPAPGKPPKPFAKSYVKDDVGHEHGNDGKFTGTGGGGAAKVKDKPKGKDKPKADDKPKDAAKGDKPEGGEAPKGEGPKDAQDAHKVENTLAAAGKNPVKIAKALGAKAAHVEHVVADYLGTGVDKHIETLSKTHPKTAKAAAATWWVAKTATKTSFATYIAGESLAEEVARQRGSSPEEAARIRGICTKIDALGAKAVPLTLSAMGVPGGAAASFLPVGSAAYLLYSTARNPVATINAARKLIANKLTKMAGGTVKHDKASNTPEQINRYVDNVNRYGDWYDALVSAALSDPNCETLEQALDVADEVIKEQPEAVEE